jgi:hypothetical protein
MKSLVLEIDSIKKMMNIKESLLNEAVVPAKIWTKLSKYFDEIAGAGERSLDELVTNKRITSTELAWLKRNASDIARKAKNIVDPANITDDMLKIFTKIVSKVPSNELSALSKKAFNNWISKNPDKINPGMSLMETLSDQLSLLKSGRQSELLPVVKQTIDGGGTWESIFKYNLERNGYKDELLDELLERFRNDVRFKNADEWSKISKGGDVGEITDELYQESLDEFTKDMGPDTASWAVRTWSEKYPMIHKIINSKFGLGSSEVAYGDAVKSADELVRMISDDVNPEQIPNLILKLKSDMIQAQTKTKSFNDVWAEIKVLIGDEKIIQKIESESGGDSFTSINKYLQMEREIASKPTFKTIYKKLKNKEYNKSDSDLITKELSEWGTMPKWGDVVPKKLRVLDSIVTRFIYGAIKWICKTKAVRFLFWENFNSIKTILKSFSKKNVRDLGFWRNVITTYFKLLAIHHLINPISNLVEEIAKSIDDQFGFGFYEHGKTDKSAVQRAWDSTWNETVKPWLNTFSDLDGNRIAKDIGLWFNPFGEGPLMRMTEGLIGWVYGLIFEKGLTNETKEKREAETKKLEEEFNNYFDEATKNALKIAENYDDKSISRITYFKTLISTSGVETYGLTADDIAKLNALTIIDGDSLYVIDPKTNGRFKIKQLPTDEYQKRMANGKDESKYQEFFWDDNGTEKTLKDMTSGIVIDKKSKLNNSIKKIIDNMIMENKPREKFGEDNFKHWKDTFLFKSVDEKNPGQYKEVKINMEDVMDRINHYRKKYDEDDAFVRAVIDTHEDVVKIMFTKDLAHIHENATPRGLALVLRVIKEERGELEIFSVARPANGNWFLVKGDYTPNQLANMDLEKKEPQSKEKEVVTKAEDDLKKKEESVINVLKRNEKEGIEELPKKVRDKIREKMGQGWSTETPPEELKEYFTTSEINSIFNDKIVIYKLKPSREFFDSLVKNSARIVIKRGFCRALQSGKKESELSERQKMTVDHILNKCNTKYESKLGLRNF